MPRGPDETRTIDDSPHGGRGGADGSKASFVLHGDDGPQATLLREGEPILVGRASHADLRVSDSGLSREHARLVWTGHELEVTDLGSTNGTTVRGARIRSAKVRPGETFALGRATAIVHAMPAVESVPGFASGAAPATGAQGPAMRALYDMVDRVAPTDAPVLIHGETGSGKELVAAAIHERSPRVRGPFKAVNCGAIPASLAESLLFGHERGAFTGAQTASPGLFEQARGGVLFLDEVAELPAALQAALLRVLEKKVVTRLGDHRERPVDVRVVAATHHDLEQRVREGHFREDLLYRLNTVTLWVPPLRERTDEVAPLATLFMERASQAWLRPVRGITPAALALLRAYPWPGNVRQLRNVVERAVVACRGEHIDVDDLLLPGQASPSGRPPVANTAPAPAPDAAEPDAAAPPAFKDVIRSHEVRMIEEALEETGGNKRAAARLLRIPIRTLTQKIKDYGIGTEQGPGDES